MDIVMASDENYAPHLATLVNSICINNPNVNLYFHVFDGGISDNTYEKITHINNKNAHFQRYFISDEMIKNRIGCEIAQDRSLTTFARIFIPDLLSDTIERALYLDVDAVVLGDLQPLFSLQGFEDYALAGVKDVNPAIRRNDVGLDSQCTYINAGMILWNLKYCREHQVVKQFIDFINQHNGNVDAMDQGTINGTLKGNIYLLEPKWNAMTPFFQLDANELEIMGGWENYYSQAEIEEAITNPVFVHFTPNYTTRPWVKKCRHPLKNQYKKYRNMTEFKMEYLEEDKRNIKLKMFSVFFNLLSYRTFVKLVNIIKK